MIGSNNEISELINEREILELMTKVNIPAISVGYVNNENVSHRELITSGPEIKPETQFEAASLSKPVFAYIVLKLAQEGKIDLDQSLDKMFDCKGPYSSRVTDGLSEITPRMILFHRSGLSITARPDEALNFEFEPGTQYGYSGVGIQCLQEAIEKHTSKTLEELFQEYLKTIMENSNFSGAAANGLRTTGTDYAHFMSAWMNDKGLEEAFRFDPSFTMKRDPWAVGLSKIKDDEIEQKVIEDETLSNIAWGLGLGLQKNSDGSITAFHSGDSTNCRALMAFNLKDKTGIVYFANSDNGLALADMITSRTVPLKQGLDYLTRKYGFERDFREGWQERETNRFQKIGSSFPPNKPHLGVRPRPLLLSAINIAESSSGPAETARSEDTQDSAQSSKHLRSAKTPFKTKFTKE